MKKYLQTFSMTGRGQSYCWATIYLPWVLQKRLRCAEAAGGEATGEDLDCVDSVEARSWTLAEEGRSGAGPGHAAILLLLVTSLFGGKEEN